ncbi:MAG: hypothetical protein UX13_C0022G0009 [Candidatus Woesebacteria bacterium GW2011_GWB1_45_5]|uniref:Uncharacterized protein n=1 Tax=Candidatus Woesebacteria bacterium GW2011_GWB1_45_5 TaxID=1618581 RepID=A0A0G1PX57_9BACT|nr:MAG: hypothetical protein UX13_C0022G0009 [Candidatus Woesebacteria bacterium GW2011_GWB1_45_5]
METQLFSKEENLSFWKNLFLVAVFFTITPITLGVSLFSLFSLKSGSTVNVVSANLISSPQSGVKVYASLPSKLPSVGGEIVSEDARPEIVRQYLESYSSQNHSPGIL